MPTRSRSLPAVSDTPQQSDWWMASDGRWYPPTQQPGPAQPPTAPEHPTATAPAYGQAPPVPPATYGQPPAYGPPPYAQPPYPGYGQTGHPTPGYGYAPAQTSGKATAVLVLGIVSLALMCGYGIGVIPAVVALIMAPGARREIEASGGRLAGEGQIKAGVICSWVAVGLVALGILAFVALIVIAGVGSSTS